MYMFPKPSGPLDNNVLIKNLQNQLAFTRKRTMSVVSNLSTYVLDRKILANLNSIGTILRHVVAMEYHNQSITFKGRMFSEEEENLWLGSLPGQLRMNLVHNYPIRYYLDHLQEAHSITMDYLDPKKDSWLFDKTIYKYQMDVNNYYCWFHYMEDETAHVGQIKMLISYMQSE